MTDPTLESMPRDVQHGAPPKCVLFDRDSASAWELEAALRAAGIDAYVHRDSKALLRQVAEDTVDVAILEESSARDENLTARLTAGPFPPAIVMVSSFGTVEGAVNAMRAGAAHYCAKPVSAEEIVLAVRKSADGRRIRQENQSLRTQLAGRHSFGELTASDPRMKEIFGLLETVAQTRATILLLGESGTGKSVLARAIHQCSPRRGAPFVDVNCGALPDSLLESELFGHTKGSFTGAVRDRAGRFESANGGTIFLDEIGTASPSLQVRLLRVLQEKVVERVGESKSRPIDVRVILATNHDLENAVKQGTFREDLYYRIHVVAVEIPPLRERRLDIPELSKHFLEKATSMLGKRVKSITPDAMRQLCARPWPGNVRELENAIERAVAVGKGDRLEAADLPTEPAPKGTQPAIEAHEIRSDLDAIPLGPLDTMLAQCERQFLARALATTGNNRTKAAAILGLHRATLYERMRRVGLSGNASETSHPNPGPTFQP